MSIYRALLTGASLFGLPVFALPQVVAAPQQNALHIEHLPATTATIDAASTVGMAALPTPSSDAADLLLIPRGEDMPLTVHTESTQAALEVPTPTTTSTPTMTSVVPTTTPDSTPVTNTRAHQEPQTVHVETSETVLQLPTAQTTAAQQPPQTTSDYHTTAPVVPQTTTPAADTLPSPSTEALTVFIAPPTTTPTAQVPSPATFHLEQPTTTPQLETPSANAVIESPPTNAVPTQVMTVVPSQPGNVISVHPDNSGPTQPGNTQPGNTIPTSPIATATYTSMGVPYITTILPTYSAAAQISSPAVLKSSQSGAVPLVAGSAVTVGGTTYSVATGGSAIYINGVSSSLSAYTHSSGASSKTSITSNAVNAHATGTASISKPLSSSSSSSVSRTLTTLSSTSTTGGPTSTATLPGAGVVNMPCLSSMGLAAVMAWVALM